MSLVSRWIDVDVREDMVHRYANPDAGNLGSPEEIPMLIYLEVFIPTDRAFEVIPQLIRDNVLSNPDANASQALLSLVVPGKLTAALLTDGLIVQPLQGAPLHFARTGDGGITVNGVNLITVDIEAANGVIHLIDGLMLPAGVPFGR